ncbi:MAG: hypothetical protein CMI02_14690 [Oceanospirillaceae bacterium]|nr:hypothetical protein [Oceanospirillaceae bacterium]MBT13270.1 hypothetical protein [Oceanospirillaceae bacterium]|tara:strand:+ start:6059 stop:6298 length:240 start_codon:yes stop_codon:yes gene_type:complete
MSRFVAETVYPHGQEHAAFLLAGVADGALSAEAAGEQGFFCVSEKKGRSACRKTGSLTRSDLFRDDLHACLTFCRREAI